MESSVVLPQPDGPTMARNSWGMTASDTSRSASTSSPVRGDANTFDTSLMRIFAVMSPARASRPGAHAA